MHSLFLPKTYVVECAGVGGFPSPSLSAWVGPGTDVNNTVADQALKALEDGGDGLV